MRPSIYRSFSLPLMAMLTLLLVPCSAALAEDFQQLKISPSEVALAGKGASFRLLVSGITADGSEVDVTHDVTYSLGDSTIASISRRGILRSRAEGTGQLQVQLGDLVATAAVTVADIELQRPLNFQHDIVPILSRFGCNASGCHGKAEGQNGFKLSVFGFNAEADFQSLVMEGRGRRLFPASAEKSLLLRKAVGTTPHGGGARLSIDRPEYGTLLAWIESGMPWGNDEDPRVVKIDVAPGERVVQTETTQQLQVTATFSDGRQEDVTRLTSFQSNNDALATVDEFGLVEVGKSPGVVAVMGTYLGQVDVFRAMVPQQVEGQAVEVAAELNFIDSHVNNQLERLNIQSSAPSSDAEFMRRVYVDVIGTLPTAAEARKFLQSKGPNRRSELVEQLMQRPEFADYWALKWADVLRVDQLQLGRKQAFQYYRWIRDSMRANKPLDQFAGDILLANGPLRESPAGIFYKAVPGANKVASTLSQVFLGVRIECAECHHHPLDRWSQRDYVGMQSYFTQVKFKGSPVGEMIFAEGDPAATHPRSGEPVFAYPLGEEMPEANPQGDRRQQLAAWFTSGDNPWFARNMANRAWAHFMGRGLVEPIDDVRLTNPPSNPELLDALGQYLADNEFDFRRLIAAITASATYQRSSIVHELNGRDEQNFSRYLFKQLEAEVFMDAICQVTGVPEKYHGVPAGSRAIQLWDSSVPHYLLKLFGRPSRTTACDCERVSEPTVGQVLHVLNSPAIHNKIKHAGGQIAELVAAYPDDESLAEELYLTFYARFPDPSERKNAVEYINTQGDRQRAAEDISWSMLNSLEFIFNH